MNTDTLMEPVRLILNEPLQMPQTAPLMPQMPLQMPQTAQMPVQMPQTAQMPQMPQMPQMSQPEKQGIKTFQSFLI